MKDVLEYLQPRPERPPLYREANASQRITFPVYEQEETHVLPEYKPAITASTLVLRKLEFLSPYDPSPSRSWRNLIMELNSTQLNFYSMEEVPMLSRVKKSKTKKHYEFTPVEHELLTEAISRSPSKYLSERTLVRSYSLQHAKFGIPIDYKKRTSCLRLRCESEQFMVQFISIDELIQWANKLSIGINVSLDLDCREMPTDRVVPRRRRSRRHNNRHRAFSDSELIRRELAEPRTARRASFAGGESTIKGKISRMFGKKKKAQDLRGANIDEIRGFLNSQETNPDEPPHSTMEEEDEEEDEEEMVAGLQEVEEEDEEDDDAHGDIDTIREMRDSEDDTDSLQEMFGAFTINSTPHTATDSASASSSSSSSSMDEKWRPEPKTYTRRKFLKDSIRCIKLLQTKDSWVGKPCVVPSKPRRLLSKSSSPCLGNRLMVEYIVGAHGFCQTA